MRDFQNWLDTVVRPKLQTVPMQNWFRRIFCKDSSSDVISKWFVRQIDTPKGWRIGGREVPAKVKEATARPTFYEGTTEISVFEVSTEIEEAEVAAAFCISKGSSPGDPMHLLRVKFEDLERAQIRMQRTKGVCNVRKVDAWHWDLIGDEATFGNLTQLLLERAQRGEDTVRMIAGRGLSNRIKEFVNANEVDRPCIGRAKNYLQTAEKRWPSE